MAIKILMLEDEETLGGLYCKKMVAQGYEVEWAKTAEEALEKIKKFSADIALIDYSIQGKEVSGMDILPQIRSSLPNAQIFMLSNYSQGQMEDDCLEAGADKYLLKIDTPPKLLLSYIEQAVQK